jgi:hypothetical protein
MSPTVKTLKPFNAANIVGSRFFSEALMNKT